MAGEVLVPVAHAQQFEVVLLVKRDGVVRALARMHAAGRDVESEARVGVDTPLEIGTQIMTWSMRVSIGVPPVLGTVGEEE